MGTAILKSLTIWPYMQNHDAWFTNTCYLKGYEILQAYKAFIL